MTCGIMEYEVVAGSEGSTGSKEDLTGFEKLSGKRNQDYFEPDWQANQAGEPVRSRCS